MIDRAARCGVRGTRGRLLEIDVPTDAERDWIFLTLQAPALHVPVGCATPPDQGLFDAGVLELRRGPEVRREPVRLHILRRRREPAPVGYFLDFGWDFPTDPTRELDLVFPDPADRSAASYFDATVIVAQHLFRSGLAKRLRWRVDLPAGREPRRSLRQGGRLLRHFEERHPVTGEWLVKCVYEYAFADYEALLRRHGWDPATDYGDGDARLWDLRRDGGAEPNRR